MADSQTTDPRLAPIIGLLDKMEKVRQPLEQQWKLNLAFYAGKQYTYVNRATNRLESQGTERGEIPPWRVRLQHNQITPSTQSYVAKLTKSKPVFYATPNDTDLESQQAADVAEAVQNYMWSHLHLTEKTNEVLTNTCISQGYWWIRYNRQAGLPVEYMVDPNGAVIFEHGLRVEYDMMMRQMGLDPVGAMQTAYMGDVCVDVLDGSQVLLDPTATNFADCKYAILCLGMDPVDIYSRWKVEVEPDAYPASLEIKADYLRNGSTQGREQTVKRVYYACFKPTPAMPRGRCVWFIKKPDQMLEEYSFQDEYPFPMLPLVQFPGIQIPGQPYYGTVISDAIPVQRELNRSLSQIVEYKNKTISPRMSAPVGSLRKRPDNMPGGVDEYLVIAGQKPEWQQTPALPPYIFDHVREMRSRIMDIFGIAEVTEGQLPPNVEAGISIDLLQEMSTDRLAPTISKLEECVAMAGNMITALVAANFDENRILDIIGTTKRAKVNAFLRFKHSLTNGLIIKCEAGSMYPRTRAGRQARVLQLVEAGLIDPIMAQKFLDVADMGGLRGELEADENQVEREIEAMLTGAPINPRALNQAMMQVQQAIAEGLVDPMQAQQVLMQAALTPHDFDNHPVHLAKLARFMKSVEFEALMPEKQEPFYMHYNLHMQMNAAQQPQPPGEAPRVSVQARGAVSAPVMAKLLQKSGVDVTEDEVLEPPLETVVFDNLDKANEPNPLDELRKQEDHEMTMDQNRAKLAQTIAQTEKVKKETNRAQAKPAN